MYCLETSVHDHMLGYIQEAKVPKEAWENLKKIFAANTMTRKLQLHQEVKNIQKRNMFVTSYNLKIKELCNSLGSISVNVGDDEMEQICLRNLAPRFGLMRTIVLARDNPPSFFDLQSMLLLEENQEKTMFEQGATPRKATCSTHIRTEEEDAAEQEADLAKDKADEVRLMITTPNFGNKMETIKEPSEEGGASIPI